MPILMTNLIHNNRYSTLIDRKKTLKIVREYVDCCNKIDDKFYEFISSSNLIPAYSIRIAIDILIRSDMRGFLKPRTILRCVTHDLGRIISPITPLKVKNVLRKNLKL